MSLILRTLLRDPLVARPLTRAIRRYDDDWFDEWSSKRMRRWAPSQESPASMMDDVSRQMVAAMNRMQEFAEDLDALDSIVGKLDKDNRLGKSGKRRKTEDLAIRRTESGGLQLALDVGDFKPEDLKIKLIDDNLVVEALNESSGKDSFRKSHFKRWFKLPEDCKLEEIRSKLTEDNKLLIDLPSSRPIENRARTIPIEMEKPKSAQGDQQSDNSASNEKQEEHRQDSVANKIDGQL